MRPTAIRTVLGGEIGPARVTRVGMVDGTQLCDVGHGTQTLLLYRGLRATAQSKQSLDVRT